MILLTTDTDSQTFYCIPRNNEIDGLFITDEQTNVEIEVTIEAIIQGDYTTSVEANFELVENHFYKLELRNGTDVVFYGKVFCTNQNNGTYQSNTTTNEFIVYE
jgi:hypothetical protein